MSSYLKTNPIKVVKVYSMFKYGSSYCQGPSSSFISITPKLISVYLDSEIENT